MSVLERYKKMLLGLFPDHLDKQLAKEKGTFSDGIINLLLSSIIAIITGMVRFAVGAMLLGIVAMGAMASDPQPAHLASMLGFGAGSIAQIALLFFAPPILIALFSLAYTIIMFPIARLMGGTGSFTQHFFQFSYPTGGKVMVESVLGLIPCVGGLMYLLVELYFLYPTFLIYKRVHKLSDGKAALLVALPIIVLGIIALVLAVLFAAAIMSMVGAFSGMGAS